MVCVDVIVKNETTRRVVEDEEKSSGPDGGLGERCGSICLDEGEFVPGYAVRAKKCVVVLRPERGFAGVEKGIVYTFFVTCGETKVRLKLDFPAVGVDSYTLEGEVCVTVHAACPRSCTLQRQEYTYSKNGSKHQVKTEAQSRVDTAFTAW